VQTRVAKALAEAGTPANRLVLIGLAAGNVKDARAYSPEKVPANTLVIHGEQDDTVPLANVLDWARPQGLPVVVAPGVDHFFHGRLALIRQQVNRLFSGEPL
jgi:alpha/beta superfamily hydrolase